MSFTIPRTLSRFGERPTEKYENLCQNALHRIYGSYARFQPPNIPRKTRKRKLIPRIWRMQNQNQNDTKCCCRFSFDEHLNLTSASTESISLFRLPALRFATPGKCYKNNVTHDDEHFNLCRCCCRFLRLYCRRTQTNTHAHTELKWATHSEWEPISLPVAFDFVYQFAQCDCEGCKMICAYSWARTHQAAEQWMESLFDNGDGGVRVGECTGTVIEVHSALPTAKKWKSFDCGGCVCARCAVTGGGFVCTYVMNKHRSTASNTVNGSMHVNCRSEPSLPCTNTALNLNQGLFSA